MQIVKINHRNALDKIFPGIETLPDVDIRPVVETAGREKVPHPFVKIPILTTVSFRTAR